MGKKTVLLGFVLLAGAAFFLATRTGLQDDPAAPDVILGMVAGPNGPEAGVWVIAETDDLPTKFVRSVVTDDLGRYVIPDLPNANYQVFSRGYGLIDSEKISLGQKVGPEGKGYADGTDTD